MSFGGPRVRASLRTAVLFVWIAVKITLVTAMLNRNVAQFIYANF